MPEAACAQRSVTAQLAAKSEKSVVSADAHRIGSVKTLADEEVVRRWLQITHAAKSKTGEIKEISQEQIAVRIANAGKVEKYRGWIVGRILVVWFPFLWFLLSRNTP